MSGNTLANQLPTLPEENMQLRSGSFSTETPVDEWLFTARGQELLKMAMVPDITDEQLQGLGEYFLTNDELEKWDICFEHFANNLSDEQIEAGPEGWDQAIFGDPKRWMYEYWSRMSPEDEYDRQINSAINDDWEYARSFSGDGPNGLRRASSVSCNDSASEGFLKRAGSLGLADECKEAVRDTLQRRASVVQEEQVKRRKSSHNI